MKEVEKQLGFKPIAQMPGRARIGGSGSGDVIVCFSKAKEHELYGTQQRGTPGRQLMRCSRALADSGGHTDSFCQNRGFDGAEFFKFLEGANEWINDHCWSAWRKQNN
jgi:hypothetical protein